MKFRHIRLAKGRFWIGTFEQSLGYNIEDYGSHIRIAFGCIAFYFYRKEGLL